MYELDNAGCEAQPSPKALGKAFRPGPRFRLLKQKEELEQVLARVNNALEILDANPGMEQFLEATQGLL